MTYTSKHAIKIDFDLASLESYTDTFLSQLWHIAQANPAPIEDRDAGEIVENIGREIIRRWLQRIQPALWTHQGRHAYSCVLTDNGHWPGPTHDRWVYGKPEETAAQVGARAAAGFAAIKAKAAATAAEPGGEPVSQQSDIADFEAWFEREGWDKQHRPLFSSIWIAAMNRAREVL